MQKPVETLAPCEAPRRLSARRMPSLARIVGITALISFSAGTIVGNACNRQSKDGKNVPSHDVQPVVPPAPVLSPEEQQIRHMVFPETNDLLYRPEPKPENNEVEL